MELSPNIISRYANLSDKEIVNLITEGKDMEAAVYLLWYRYEPLIHRIYNDVFYDSIVDLYEEVLMTLFITLCGDNGQWERLARFNWQYEFRSWLRVVVIRYFYAIKKQMIPKDAWICPISICEDDDDIDYPTISDDETDHEAAKQIILDVIKHMKDKSRKFVLLKRLEGYNSKDIAEMLESMWEQKGIVRKDSKGKVIKPSAAYVDWLLQRAKKEIKAIILSHMKSINE